jgi:hypothetical protein
MDLEVQLKPHANAIEINRKKQDKYKVSWVTPSSGNLSCYKNNTKCEDAEFVINGNTIEMRNWVSRHNVWETNYYKKRK